MTNERVRPTPNRSLTVRNVAGNSHTMVMEEWGRTFVLHGSDDSWKGKTEEISGAEPDTTNLRMEVTAACVALETIDEGHVVTIYSDSSYLINCMRRGWYKKWLENGWLNDLRDPVANRDLWERLLEATQRHQEVRWRKVKGHSKTAGPHKTGNDRADALAVSAKEEATRPSTPSSP